MTIQDLGSIGELIAAIATVATLAYLAAQIRQNTKQARLTTNRELVSSIQDGFAPLYNPGNVRIWRLGRYHPDQLDEDERQTFGMLLERQVYNFQNFVHQYESDAVDEDLFRSTLGFFRGLLATPGGAAWWDENSSFLTPSTRRYLEGAAPQGAAAATQQPGPIGSW